MKKVKMFFVCLFACLSVFAQKSETVVSDVTASQGISPEYIEPFDSIQAAKIIRQLIQLLNELDECTDEEGRKIKDSEKKNPFGYCYREPESDRHGEACIC